ncbi:MAG: S9 family peptidase [bacterium]|nr:S9 family peptidase [bacterium]
MNKTPANPPIAPKHRETTNVHGHELNDDYGWLRADNWQDVLKDPSVLASDIRTHLEAENAYTGAIMTKTEGLQETLYEEMKGRIKEDDSSVPSPDGPYNYYSRVIEGEQYPVFCRRPIEGGEEQVYLDGNKQASGHAFHQIHAASHSPDHKLLAWSYDTQGSGYCTLVIEEIDTGMRLDTVIENTGGGIFWSRDTRYLFYAKYDDHNRIRWIYRHKLGTKISDDVMIFEEEDTGFFLGLSETQSGRFILIDAHDHETHEVRLIDAQNPLETPKLIAVREKEHEYSVEHDQSNDRLIIHTNCQDAQDFKIMEAPLSDPRRENWRDIVPYQQGRLILDVVAMKRHLVRLERENALPRIVITSLKDNEEHTISFEEEAYSIGMSAGYEYDTDTTRFTYSSPTTPSQVFDYDMRTKERTLRKTQEVPSGHDPKDYITRRIIAPARDGEQIPVTLLYRASTKIDGSAPMLLYGYGSYGISIPAGFSTVRLSLVDRGFVYAIAHIRGGEEKGRAWYLDGKRANKKNTFNDFIDSAQHLIDKKFTRKGQIIAQGGSAGGMLMGVVANWAGELFGGIIAEVPFVDVLNTMLDDTLPLTPPEWLQWGNPIKSQEEYEYIASYSPYDNVEARDYPPLLVLSGIADSAVTYWEPAKWVAKLREMKTNDEPLLLKLNMEAGHGGASGRFDYLKEIAVAQAFAIEVKNLQNTGS